MKQSATINNKSKAILTLTKVNHTSKTCNYQVTCRYCSTSYPIIGINKSFNTPCHGCKRNNYIEVGCVKYNKIPKTAIFTEDES